MQAAARADRRFPSRTAWRGLLAQACFLAVVIFLLYEAYAIGRANMLAHHIPTDFAFLQRTSGFDINQRLIPYSSVASYGRAFCVGLLNTLIVAVLGLGLATVLGFTIGIARLSQNLIVAKLALIYVEALRNVPLLLQLLFWYNAVLKPLPLPEQSLALPGGIFINNRGIVLPELALGRGLVPTLVVLVASLLCALLFWRATAQKRETSSRPAWGAAALAISVLPALAIGFWLPPFQAAAEPALGRFNFAGGWHIRPEFIALLLGLSTYTASFIAEIVRAGLLSVPRGITEAGAALALTRAQILRQITVPLAMRVIIPPLTSQYVNLVKNSSLAVFIGYPDLVQVFAGTVLNQTGAAVQVMMLTMAVYLCFSLMIAAAMNLFNRRIALPGHGR